MIQQYKIDTLNIDFETTSLVAKGDVIQIDYDLYRVTHRNIQDNVRHLEVMRLSSRSRKQAIRFVNFIIDTKGECLVNVNCI